MALGTPLYVEKVELMNHTKRVRQLLSDPRFIISRQFDLTLDGVAYIVNTTRNSISFLDKGTAEGMTVCVSKGLLLNTAKFSCIRNDNLDTEDTFNYINTKLLPDHYVRIWYILLCTDFLSY